MTENLWREHLELSQILKILPRSPLQKNELSTSDVEILKIRKDFYLTSSTDSVADEISSGLYETPSTWAWLTVMSSVSDLAASGSKALGLLLSTQWQEGHSQSAKRSFYREIKKACEASCVPVLGGDSGSSPNTVLTSTILGESSSMPLNRMSARAGDLLFLHTQDQLGRGAALAYSYLLKSPLKMKFELSFRPTPSWKLAQKLRPFVRASIDTSDGVAIALYILASLNGLGFQLDAHGGGIPANIKLSLEKLRIPQELTYLCDLGDLQTLFVVSPQNAPRFRKTPGLTELGILIKEKRFVLKSQNGIQQIPMKDLLAKKSGRGDYLDLMRSLRSHFRH